MNKSEDVLVTEINAKNYLDIAYFLSNFDPHDIQRSNVEELLSGKIEDRVIAKK
jgi:hypothetical protein